MLCAWYSSKGRCKSHTFGVRVRVSLRYLATPECCLRRLKISFFCVLIAERILPIPPVHSLIYTLFFILAAIATN